MDTLVPSALHWMDRMTPSLLPVLGHTKDPPLPSGRTYIVERKLQHGKKVDGGRSVWHENTWAARRIRNLRPEMSETK